MPTAGYRDPHCGALTIDGTVAPLCGVSFTPQPDLVEPEPPWPRASADPPRCCPTCLTTSTRQPTKVLTQTDGATVAGLIDTL